MFLKSIIILLLFSSIAFTQRGQIRGVVIECAPFSGKGGVVRGCVRQARADCAPGSGITGYGAKSGPCHCGAWGAKCATLNEKYRVRMKVTLFEFGNGHFRRRT